MLDPGETRHRRARGLSLNTFGGLIINYTPTPAQCWGRMGQDRFEDMGV